MHELEGEQLPHEPAFQPFLAQRKIMILDIRTVRITGNQQFEDKDDRIDNDERHGQRQVSSVFRLAHIITIFKHKNQPKLVAKPLFFNGFLRHAPPPAHPDTATDL